MDSKDDRLDSVGVGECSHWFIDAASFPSPSGEGVTTLAILNWRAAGGPGVFDHLLSDHGGTIGTRYSPAINISLSAETVIGVIV